MKRLLLAHIITLLILKRIAQIGHSAVRSSIVMKNGADNGDVSDALRGNNEKEEEE